MWLRICTLYVLESGYIYLHCMYNLAIYLHHMFYHVARFTYIVFLWCGYIYIHCILMMWLHLHTLFFYNVATYTYIVCFMVWLHILTLYVLQCSYIYLHHMFYDVATYTYTYSVCFRPVLIHHEGPAYRHGARCSINPKVQHGQEVSRKSVKDSVMRCLKDKESGIPES